MRHLRIHKSNRHKKLKAINASNDDHFVESHVSQKNIGEQTIPRKWLQMKEQMRQKTPKKRKKKKKDALICIKSETETIERGMTRSDKQLPQLLEQGLYESEYHFMQRLTKLSAKARAEATIEDRFDVDFCPKIDSKEDPIDNEIDDKKDSKNKTINKNLKRKQKMLKKKERKSNKKKKNENSFEHLKDVIKFGERVSEPPDLTQFKSNKKVKK